MRRIRKLHTSLTFNIIGAVVLLLVLFSLIVSAIGYYSFTRSFKNEYSTTTYHMAETAATLVHGEHFASYLRDGGKTNEFLRSKWQLDEFCDKLNVSLVYVIMVDTSDYGRFTSIFNSVGPDAPYTPWELGHQQNTTNDEYRQIYRDIYENGLEYGTIYRTTNLNGAPPHITTLVPVNDLSGNVAGILCIQRPIEELQDGTRPYLINIAISTLLLSVSAAIFWASYIKKQFVGPVRKIIGEAHRFAAENTVGEKLGDQTSQIDDLADLAHSIDKMEEDMLSYIENLTTVTAEKERIGTELSIASVIQENAIPHLFPPFPERDDFDIYASMDPAKEVGGDYYNFFLVDDTHLAMVIADVSGKGIPAALFMMFSNILISERAHMGGSPAEILTFVNQRICEHNRADMFVTVWFGIIDLETGKVVAANAGHDDPAICHKGGEFELVKSRHGLVIGAMENIRYTDFEIQLNKGDKIFLYTDGVPEATDGENNLFTIARMLKVLNEHKEKNPRQILEGVRAGVDAFVGDVPQFDDLTMLCLELTEMDANNILHIAAERDSLPEVIDFIDRFLEANDCPMKAQTQIELSVEEIFVNIASYAYGGDTGMAEVAVSREGDDVIIVFKDSGVPYDPLAKADPDTKLSAEEREIGGLGIYLVKKNMDSVSYAYEDGKNILTMRKTI